MKTYWTGKKYSKSLIFGQKSMYITQTVGEYSSQKIAAMLNAYKKYKKM